jgi:phenylacetic acid degradation operon negative regulatory protein
MTDGELARIVLSHDEAVPPRPDPARSVVFGRMPPAERTVPRNLRSGSTSQGLLVTLLGDYWAGASVYIPSAALVDLLGEFDISAQAARAALSRVQRAGYLEGERDGRTTAYRLTAEVAARGTTVSQQMMRFSAQTPEGAPRWDGTWTLVAYTLQAEQAEERRRIRRALRGLGFGPLQDAVWISPKRRAARVLDAIGDEPALSFGVFEDARLVEGVDIDVARIWDLDALAERYRLAIGLLDEIAAATSTRSTLDPTQALVLRTEAMDRWRSVMPTDPRLPPDLLPRRWPGWAARQKFAKVYDRLAPVAADRVREIVAVHSTDAADAVHHHTVAAAT